MSAIVKLCRTFVLVGFALFVAAPLPASAADFAGLWSVSGVMGGRVVTELSAVCTLRQSGDTVAGSCTGPTGGGAAAGNVNGPRILWQCHVIATNARGITTVVTLHGTLVSAHVIHGTWTMSARPGVTGTFTATRA
jgi:hypothetical protein